MQKRKKTAGDTYREAGVDIDLAHDLLERAKSRIAATRRPETLAPIGGFGGLFRIDTTRYRNPVMVTSIDGVGTKLIVASMMDRHHTVGHDIVNHCINDIAVQGAEPLYFLDYVGIGRLRSPLYEQVLTGLAEACAAQNVTLIGGETAEMPGMYGDHYDLVGCITGIVDRDEMISGETVQAGDLAVGLLSNGLHTNGYSLARRVLFDKAGHDVHTEFPELGGNLGEALLKPHICYWPAIRVALAEGVAIHGMAHITGGGLCDNVPRILPDRTAVTFDLKAVQVPPIFRLIRELGDIEDEEMYRVFNMGVGMVWLLPPDSLQAALEVCRATGFEALPVGEVIRGEKTVTIHR